jgi:hypothetical protein
VSLLSPFSSLVIQTPIFLINLSDESIIFISDVGKNHFQLFASLQWTQNGTLRDPRSRLCVFRSDCDQRCNSAKYRKHQKWSSRKATMMNPWQSRRLLPPPHLPLSHFSVIANGERPILQVDRPSRLSSIILVDGTKDRLLSVMLMECGDGNRRGISE